MNLNDFKTTNKGKHIRLVASVADTSGARDYEIRIAGPAAAVKRVLSKSDFSIEIDPHREAQSAEKELAKCVRAQKSEFTQLAQLEHTSKMGLFKEPVQEPDAEKSIFISLQRTRGEGTFWALAFPYFLGTGWNIFLYPPPAAFLVATVTPSTGDQDLFLNSVFGPLLGSARAGSTTPDTVFYPGPPFGLLRVRILGFTAGFGNFSMLGFS